MADNQNPTRDELEDMDEGQLQALATQRGITVTASDGSGTPSVDDYVNALAPADGTAAATAELGTQVPTAQETQGIHPAVAAGDDRARAAQIAALQAPGKGRLDQTIRGGRYVNTQGQFVNAHGQRIDEEGNLLDGESPDEFAEK
jgi:hypothetical protein